jgi:hypothetical protein
MRYDTLWSKFFWGLAVSLMWKHCKFLDSCWSSMTSLHMVGVKICLCFDSQAFPQIYKKHMFWQPREAVGRGETCTSLWWESIDGEFATMKPSSFSQRINQPNFATARNPSKSYFWREPPVLASSSFFNFKEPWVPWILAFFPFSGTHGPTPEQLFTLLKIPVLVFSKKKSKVGTNMKNYECICFMSACSLQWIPEQA